MSNIEHGLSIPETGTYRLAARVRAALRAAALRSAGLRLLMPLRALALRSSGLRLRAAAEACLERALDEAA